MQRRRLLKGAAGFAAGLALWLTTGPFYHPIVTRTAEQFFHLAEHPNVTSLEPAENDAILDRSDFDRRSPRPQIPVRDLTFNVILLLTLFGAAGPSLSLANGWRWAASLVALFGVHAAALATKVMALYVLRLGAWSRVNYGEFERNFWSGADHFYRILGMYAVAFVIWWIARPSESEAEPKPARTRPRSKKR